MDKPMISYCGEMCTECSAYVATRSDDAAALQRVADEWNARFGTSLRAEGCVCDGCIGEGRRIGYCRTCEVRACAIERGLENCAHCEEYARQGGARQGGCQKLTVCFENSPECKDVLDEIRQSLE